jgi:HSP20 family molecular chaperone IbpA
MSLIPHMFHPRSSFNTDNWHLPLTTPANMLAQNTMDLFDPFDELDHMIGQNMEWLSKPEFIQPMLPVVPKVPQKYRITVDCVGYKPSSIKTDVVGHKLTVTAREEEKGHSSDDFHVKEFKKTYVLPSHCETDKLVSFMTSHGQLVIEFPLRETIKHSNDDLFPRVVDVPGSPSGAKQVQMKFHVPESIDPTKIHVSIKDRDLIVKAEDKVEKPDSVSRFYYYKRTTLPENTVFRDLKCNYDNHQISIEAPVNLEFKSHRTVPIDYHKKPAHITHK